MSTNSDSRWCGRRTARAPIGGSSARQELDRARKDLRRFDAESVAIVRSAGEQPHDARSMALQPDLLY